MHASLAAFLSTTGTLGLQQHIMTSQSFQKPANMFLHISLFVESCPFLPFSMLDAGSELRACDHTHMMLQ
jgi:hypothetical protein